MRYDVLFGRVEGSEDVVRLQVDLVAVQVVQQSKKSIGIHIRHKDNLMRQKLKSKISFKSISHCKLLNEKKFNK